MSTGTRVSWKSRSPSGILFLKRVNCVPHREIGRCGRCHERADRIARRRVLAKRVPADGGVGVWTRIDDLLRIKKRTMGKRNYLIEGVSGTGKSSVCQELRRRGYVAINGDRELAYQGDPTTGEKTEGFGHEHHIWDVEKVRRLAANQDDEATFFCGGSRNFKQFIDLFDEIFILDVDAETLNERLDSRPDDDWGKRKSERELILRLHATKEDVPSSGIVLDATQPLVSVVDEILSHVRA
jgi:hypothetical protein